MASPRPPARTTPAPGAAPVVAARVHTRVPGRPGREQRPLRPGRPRDDLPLQRRRGSARLLRPRRRARRGWPHAAAPAHRGVHDREPGRHVGRAGAVAGADVVPWRPGAGRLPRDRGRARHRSTPSSTFPVWPASGGTTAHPAPAPTATDARGRQVTYCYLDDDPVATAERLGEVMRAALGVRRRHRAAGRAVLRAGAVRVDPLSAGRRRGRRGRPGGRRSGSCVTLFAW